MQIMQELKQLFVGAMMALIVGFSLVPALPATASAAVDPKAQACAAINNGDTTCAKGPGPTVGSIVKSAIDILSVILGVIAVFMVIIGGLKYVTSQGDASATASAKNTIIYAMVGIIIVVVAQFIVHFAIQTATGVKTPGR